MPLFFIPSNMYKRKKEMKMTKKEENPNLPSMQRTRNTSLFTAMKEMTARAIHNIIAN